MRKLLALAAVLVMSGTSLAAQSVLSGTVREDSTGRPLAGVEVLLERANLRSVTDAAGRYVLGPLPAGAHWALFRFVGYQPVRVMVRAVEDTVWANALMLRATVQLAPVVVTGEPAKPRGIGREAFEERRRMGFGKFIDSTQLRRSEHLRVEDVLRRNSMIKFVVKQEGALRKVFAVGARKPGPYGRPCYMQVILDGVVLYASGWDHIDPPDLWHDFEISNLEAVEVYEGAGATPIEFSGTGAACGTVVLWTRRP